MFGELMIVVALNCPTTKIVNTSHLQWTAHDSKEVETAKRHCNKYYPEAPCLKVFEKYDYNSYRATCGKPNN